MSESNKMKEMQVNKLMIQMGIPIILYYSQQRIWKWRAFYRYSETWSAGLHVKIPFLERVAKKVSLKEQVADFPPQPAPFRSE